MTTITTPAAAIASALGINTDDDRIRIEVTNTGWDNAMCEETGAPGAVLAEWVTYDSDGERTVTDRTLAGTIAGDYINVLLMSDQVDQYEMITVKVARPYIRFVFPGLADLADRVDMPAPIRIAA